MVLPELRALANRAGVKGASGMRKSQLIAAIRESQGHANGAPANGTDAGKSGGTAIDAPAERDRLVSADAPGRESHGASHEAKSPATDVAEATDGAEKGTTSDIQTRTRDEQDTTAGERKSDKGGDQQGPDGKSNQENRTGDDDGEGSQGRRGRRFRERRRRG
jgi:transcription termination factor Rho